jgi:hypothetical protein
LVDSPREGWLSELPDPPSAPVAALLASLLSSDALTRTRGLDAVAAVVRAHGAEALPYLLTLSSAKGYPGASALLARLFALLAAIDDPPRAGPEERDRAAYERYRDALPRMIRHASTARDPAAARLAALLCARFPSADGELERLLVALLTGTSDPDERARLLYALTRIQASRGAPFHARVAGALHREELDAEKIAVSLALAEHDPPEPLRGRVAGALRAACTMTALSDPRAWGRALDRSALDRGLERLGQASRGG